MTVVRDGRRMTVMAEGHDVSKGGIRLAVLLKLHAAESFMLEFVLPYTSTPIVVRGVVRHQDGMSYESHAVSEGNARTE